MTTAIIYTILSGDTISSIADGINAAAGVPYQTIEEANPDVPASVMQPGMVLNIPAKDSSKTVLRYTVMSGDSYWQISEGLKNAAGVSCDDIETANPGADPSDLSIGSVLNIPQPGSVPEPQPGPTPAPVPVPEAEHIGVWYAEWNKGLVHPPVGCNIGLAFSGWNDVETALSLSDAIYKDVPDVKYITFGGGNEKGVFTEAVLEGINNAITGNKLSAYKGIAYDIEEGDPGLAEAFSVSFALAKKHGFKVLVTVSHSAPYGIDDAYALMQSFFADENIDMLSPQLYTSGDEPENNYDTTYGVTWDLYANAKAQIVPSIVRPSYYADAIDYFKKQGVTLEGYIQWSTE